MNRECFHMDKIIHGNVKELWKISYPIMISFFALFATFFLDRIFLYWYSMEAFHAMAQVSLLTFGIFMGWMTLAGMSEVFVSQYNGACQRHLIGGVIWQMIWLAVFSTIFFCPLAIWGARWIYDPIARPQEFSFFRIVIFFGPIYVLGSALSGLQVGLGQTKVVQWAFAFGCSINVILGPILIFGVKGFVPSFGIRGAAVATVVGTVSRVIIFFIFFVHKKYWMTCGLNRWWFDRTIFFSVVRIGLPTALFICIEWLGLAFFYHMMGAVSFTHIFVSSVCQSFLLLFLFFEMGLEKGTLSLSGNFMGRGEVEKVYSVLFSSFKLIGVFTIFLIFILVVWPFPWIDFFVRNIAHILPEDLPIQEVKYLIRIGLIFTALHLCLENFRWIFNGILIASGDTLFLFFSSFLGIFFVLVIPTYVFVFLYKANVIYAFLLETLYFLSVLLMVVSRFIYGGWKANILFSQILSGLSFHNERQREKEVMQEKGE